MTEKVRPHKENGPPLLFIMYMNGIIKWFDTRFTHQEQQNLCILTFANDMVITAELGYIPSRIYFFF